MAANTPVIILRTVRFLTLVAVLVEPIETKLRGPSPAPRKNRARPGRDAPRRAILGGSCHGNRWNLERHRGPLAAGERPLSCVGPEPSERVAQPLGTALRPACRIVPHGRDGGSSVNPDCLELSFHSGQWGRLSWALWPILQVS